MPTKLRGLTWDHPRAVRPLLAAQAVIAERLPDVRLSWETQPLSGFEARPLAEIVEQYDLLVFDHPHVGEAARDGSLRRLDGLAATLGLSEADFAGPSLASYRYDGGLWGLPIDAACQVACFRRDVLARLDAPVPRDWAGVLVLGQRARRAGMWLAASLGGVHAMMTMLTLCANLDRPLGRTSDPAFADRSAARGVLDAMRELAALCPAEALGWNSIALQNAMRDRDDLVFCPAVYGFSTYARPEGGGPALDYADFPGLTGLAGSTLGGAGLGISSRCHAPDAAEAVAGLLASAPVQAGVIAAAGGQPAHRAAWDDAAADPFYRETRATIESAWVRPRFPGYLDFQREGGPIVESYLRNGDADRTLDRLEIAWAAAWRAAA